MSFLFECREKKLENDKSCMVETRDKRDNVLCGKGRKLDYNGIFSSGLIVLLFLRLLDT